MPENRPSRSQGIPCEEKRVMMPSAEEMTTKLTETGLIGVAPQTDKFYLDFVKRVSGGEKVASGLNLAWELSLYDTMRDYPSVVIAALNLGYDLTIDTITPDKEVAEAAKTIRKQILEELRRES